MDSATEQKFCLNFCVKNGISCVESLKMLRKAFGESCMSEAEASRWYESFEGGRESVNDLKRAAQPTASANETTARKSKRKK